MRGKAGRAPPVPNQGDGRQPDAAAPRRRGSVVGARDCHGVPHNSCATCLSMLVCGLWAWVTTAGCGDFSWGVSVVCNNLLQKTKHYPVIVALSLSGDGLGSFLPQQLWVPMEFQCHCIVEGRESTDRIYPCTVTILNCVAIPTTVYTTNQSPHHVNWNFEESCCN